MPPPRWNDRWSWLRLTLHRLGLGRRQAAPASSPPAATTLLVGVFGTPTFCGGVPARLLQPHWGGHDAGQPAGTPPPAWLLACVWILLLDPLFELRQPLLHRPLDLRSGSARLLGPDAWPVRPNGFGRWVGVGRFGFDRELRREFRHLCESYPWSLPEPVGERSS